MSLPQKFAAVPRLYLNSHLWSELAVPSTARAPSTLWSMETAQAAARPGRAATWPSKLHHCLLNDAMKMKGKLKNPDVLWCEIHYFLVWLKGPQFLFRDYIGENNCSPGAISKPSWLCGLCKWQSLLCWVSIFCFSRGRNSSAGTINRKLSFETQLPPLCQ